MSSFDDLDDWFTNIAPVKPKKAAKINDVVYSKKVGNPKVFTQNLSTSSRKGAIDKLISITQKKSEVLVKLRSSTKSLYQLKTHLKYVSREGNLHIENQDGDLFNGQDDINALVEQWQAFGFPQYKSKVRESFHFIFSMPPGTDEKAELKAVRDLCKLSFAGHKYTLVQHLDEKHPHVHVCVMALNDKGKRLNPRKADLAHYRDLFVEKLGDYGVEATATRRYQRFKSKRSEKTVLRHMRKRSAKPKVYTQQAEMLKNSVLSGDRPVNPAENFIADRNQRAELLYSAVANDLEKLGKTEEAKSIRQFVQDMKVVDKRSMSQLQYDYLQNQREKNISQEKSK